MAPDEKAGPSAPLPGPSLPERVARALEDETIRRSVSVKMTVRGGMERTRFAFDFVATGDGYASCRFEDRLRHREGDSGERKAALGSEQFVSLLKRLQPALESPVEMRSFLPDTLIGVLEISVGNSTRRIYFAADPEQAESQGKVPPPELRQAVDAVYALGATLTGSRLVKP